MKIIMLGAPGSGKGTQAEYIVKAFHMPRISTGDMLRAAVLDKTALGREVQVIMETGRLIPDEIILALVKERIALTDCFYGFLLDGFPRTVGQAEALLRTGIDVDYVIDIKVPDAEIIKRLTGRLMHLPSGRIYHIEFNPPKVAGVDDYTGELLTQREDDKKEVVIQRLAIYHKHTEPLAAWYQSQHYSGQAEYIQVSGIEEPEKISQIIVQSLAG